MPSPIVRAIDVGFGRTKVATTDLQHDTARSFGRTAFPSLVVASGKLRGQMFMNSDCVEVEADGRLWRTVPDDLSEVSAGTSRFQTPNFYTSSEYLALLRAGLATMTLPGNQLDCLGIGMPCNVIREHPGIFEELERRVTGEHPVPTAAGVVTVRRVCFAPQGVAALARLLAVEPLLRGAPDNIRLLTIDAGYGTLLWCTSHGKRVSAMGTDGCFGSVASALRQIAKEVDPASFANVQLTQAIDDAIRLGQPLRWAGRLHEADKFVPMVRVAMETSLSALTRGVGSSFAAYDAIFLTGGGAPLLHAQMQRIAGIQGRLHLMPPDEAPFHNVGGMLHLARAEARQVAAVSST